MCSNSFRGMPVYILSIITTERLYTIVKKRLVRVYRILFL